MTHEAVNANSKKVWQSRKSTKEEIDKMFALIDDVDRVDGGEAGAEDERATQASATITKNAAHLKKVQLHLLTLAHHSL